MDENTLFYDKENDKINENSLLGLVKDPNTQQYFRNKTDVQNDLINPNVIQMHRRMAQPRASIVEQAQLNLCKQNRRPALAMSELFFSQQRKSVVFHRTDKRKNCLMISNETNLENLIIILRKNSNQRMAGELKFVHQCLENFEYFKNLEKKGHNLNWETVCKFVTPKFAVQGSSLLDANMELKGLHMILKGSVNRIKMDQRRSTQVTMQRRNTISLQSNIECFSQGEEIGQEVLQFCKAVKGDNYVCKSNCFFAYIDLPTCEKMFMEADQKEGMKKFSHFFSLSCINSSINIDLAMQLYASMQEKTYLHGNVVMSGSSGSSSENSDKKDKNGYLYFVKFGQFKLVAHVKKKNEDTLWAAQNSLVTHIGMKKKADPMLQMKVCELTIGAYFGDEQAEGKSLSYQHSKNGLKLSFDFEIVCSSLKGTLYVISKIEFYKKLRPYLSVYRDFLTIAKKKREWILQQVTEMSQILSVRIEDWTHCANISLPQQLKQRNKLNANNNANQSVQTLNKLKHALVQKQVVDPSTGLVHVIHTYGDKSKQTQVFESYSSQKCIESAKQTMAIIQLNLRERTNIQQGSSTNSLDQTESQTQPKYKDEKRNRLVKEGNLIELFKMNQDAKTQSKMQAGARCLLLNVNQAYFSLNRAAHKKLSMKYLKSHSLALAREGEQNDLEQNQNEQQEVSLLQTIPSHSHDTTTFSSSLIDKGDKCDNDIKQLLIGKTNNAHKDIKLLIDNNNNANNQEDSYYSNRHQVDTKINNKSFYNRFDRQILTNMKNNYIIQKEPILESNNEYQCHQEHLVIHQIPIIAEQISTKSQIHKKSNSAMSVNSATKLNQILTQARFAFQFKQQDKHKTYNSSKQKISNFTKSDSGYVDFNKTFSEETNFFKNKECKKFGESQRDKLQTMSYLVSELDSAKESLNEQQRRTNAFSEREMRRTLKNVFLNTNDNYQQKDISDTCNQLQSGGGYFSQRCKFNYALKANSNLSQQQQLYFPGNCGYISGRGALSNSNAFQEQQSALYNGKKRRKIIHESASVNAQQKAFPTLRSKQNQTLSGIRGLNARAGVYQGGKKQILDNYYFFG